MFKANHGFVWRVLPQLGVAPADRGDALQEVFEVVHRRLHEYRELPMAEAALAVVCPLATAHARLRHARERVSGLVARAERRGEVP